MTTGYGSTRVDTTIGATERSTPLFLSTDHDNWILAVKTPVGAKEKLDLGDQVNLTVSPVFGHDRQSASLHT